MSKLSSPQLIATIVCVLCLQYLLYYHVSSFRIGLNQNQPISLKLKSSFSNEVVTVPDSPDPIPRQKLNESLNGNLTNDEALSTCPITAQIKIVKMDNGQWFLQTIDENGNFKSIGGDEFYIEFRSHDNSEREHPTAVATFDDNEDGTYTLEFFEPFMTDTPSAQNSTDGGSLRVFLQYTCGIGTMAPPSRDEWSRGGYFTEIKWEKVLNVTPPIKKMPAMELSNNRTLSEYDLVLYVGDSIMENLHSGGQPPFQEKAFFVGSVANPLNTTTLNLFVDRMKFTIARGKRNVAVPANPKIAIILGSALWDVLVDMEQGPSFENHLKAIEEYIKEVKIDTESRSPEQYDLYWKLPTALHVHVVPYNARFIARYMSTSRIRKLYELQKELMEKLELPIMDYYLASYLSCYYLKPGDGRHYNPTFNKAISNQFFWGSKDRIDDKSS